MSLNRRMLLVLLAVALMGGATFFGVKAVTAGSRGRAVKAVGDGSAEGQPRPSPDMSPRATPHAPPAPPAPPLACGALDFDFNSPPGLKKSTTAGLGPVSATFGGTTGLLWSMAALPDARITIRRDGRTLLSEAVGPAEPKEPTATMPASISGVTGTGEGNRPLCIARFVPDAQPVVLLGLWTAGAHCCTFLRAFPLTAGGVGDPVTYPIGNPGVDVRELGDRAIVVTADDDFNYAFACYACSAAPVQVLAFEDDGFADITRKHLDLVRKEAPGLWKSFERDPAQGLGILPAWVAGECLLGRGARAWNTVEDLLKRGKLAGDPKMSPDEFGWPTGAEYVQKLHRFLADEGYCT